MEDLRLADLIARDHILADMQAQNKEDALAEISRMLSAGHGAEMHGRMYEALMQRERLASTGIGDQVAIPHGKLDQLPSMLAGLARSRTGIDFGAIDGQPTRLFFVIVAPGNANGLHLRALARVARLCKSANFRSRLLAAERPAEMYEVLRAADEELSSSSVA